MSLVVAVDRTNRWLRKTMASVITKQFSGKLTGDGWLEIPESGDMDTLTRQKTEWLKLSIHQPP